MLQTPSFIEHLNTVRSKSRPFLHLKDIDKLQQGLTDKCMWTLPMSLVACSKEITKNEMLNEGNFS